MYYNLVLPKVVMWNDIEFFGQDVNQFVGFFYNIWLSYAVYSFLPSFGN